MNQEFDMDALIKRIQEEEEIVKSQTLSYQDYLPEFIARAQEDIEVIEGSAIELEKDNQNADEINAMFRSFHNIKGSSGFVGQTIIQKAAHQTETLLDGCRKNTVKVTEAVINLILKSADIIKAICDNLDLNDDETFIEQVYAHVGDLEEEEKRSVVGAQDSETPMLGEILVEENKLKPKDVQEIVDKQKTVYPELKFGEVAVQENKVEPKDVLGAIKTQQSKSKKEEYMRISTDRVDSLVDMVGELVISQSLVEQQAITVLGSENDFINNFARMARITKDIQNIAMEVRMVPLKSTFSKITRVARDTIHALGKDIDFSTTGDDTEIDRIVTEKIYDPLVHLVKNALSHGIEDSQEERTNAGKEAKGKVKVAAANKRGSIYIEITDDGGGINAERVYQKALEKGLIDPNKEYSEREIQEFIMLPGFSTVEVANDIAGRGVGMDVVKTEIQKIGGKIELISEQGKGSTFTLKIPLNHAIMNGTVIAILGTNYIIPTLNIKQIIQPTDDQWVYVQGKRSRITNRGDIIPLVSLQQLFESKEEESDLVVILELDQKYRALPVKNVIGRQEVVVKPAGEEFSHLDYVSGMSILGDGKVSLILDIESMFKKEGE